MALIIGDIFMRFGYILKVKVMGSVDTVDVRAKYKE